MKLIYHSRSVVYYYYHYAWQGNSLLGIRCTLRKYGERLVSLFPLKQT